MANVFNEARKKVQELKNSINPVIRQTFEEYGYVIHEYQTQKQLYEKGEDSKGSIIRPAYRPSTIRIKRKKGQPTDRVTWKDTGVLYDSIRVEPKDDYVEITANTSYAKYLLKKYGDNVLGIQEELLKEFANKYLLIKLKENFDGKLTES